MNASHFYLVTGASGLLGSNLVAAIRKRRAEVVGISHSHGGKVFGVPLVRSDLRNERSTEELIQAFQPQWIIHCAAATNVDWCDENPVDAYRMNAEMTRIVVRAARRVGSGVVYISTDSVFDGERSYYSEVDAPSPINVYARSKLEGEKAVLAESETSLVVRTNIYGWNFLYKKSLAEWILENLMTGETFPAFRDMVFTPILVNDLSDAILDMIVRGATGVYHVAGSQSCSKLDFALRLANAFGLNETLVQPASISDSTLKAPRPKNTSLNVSKAVRILGRALPDADTGLRRFKELLDSGFVAQLRCERKVLYAANQG
jgi:dTDP-4-dehydrorhamnose reductase